MNPGFNKPKKHTVP